MHGSSKALELKEKFMVEISRDPSFRSYDIHDLSKSSIRERTMEKFGSMVYYVINEPLREFNLRMQVGPRRPLHSIVVPVQGTQADDETLILISI